MRKSEYKKLCKAIFHFMEDEPKTEEEAKSFGGWESGMDLISELREAYEKRCKSTGDTERERI